LHARTELVHDADPAARTFAILTEPDRFEDFGPAVDIPAIDPYPCKAGLGCDFGMISQYVHALRHAVGNGTWWAEIQAVSSAPSRWPTQAELHEIIRSWCGAAPDGFVTFAWDYGGGRLADHPELLSELKVLNIQGCGPFGGGTTTPTSASTTTPDSSTTTRPGPTTTGSTTTTAPMTTTTGATTTTVAGTLVMSCPVVPNPVRGQQVICTIT
jgi:hypothetical protein